VTVRVGIMQGRLSTPPAGRIQGFPAASWAEEFPRARAAGLSCIEWIYETSGADANPLGTDAGVARLRALADAHGVHVWSVCADWYMEERLVGPGGVNPTSVEHLRWLVGRCGALSVRYVILPFVDSSSLRSEAERAAIVTLLRGVAPVAADLGVEIHLETDLPPARFRALLEAVGHPAVRANYDTGNSAALGYDPAEELTLLGPWLGSVHIKDRVRGGGTVPLGSGDANFAACFRAFRSIGFARWYVLQVARGETGAEVDWAVRNRQFVERQVLEAAA